MPDHWVWCDTSTHIFAATGDDPGGFAPCARTWNLAIPLATGQ